MFLEHPVARPKFYDNNITEETTLFLRRVDINNHHKTVIYILY